MTPKLHLALSLTLEFTRANRATLIFSPLLPPLRLLSGALEEAGIDHHLLDNTVPPHVRAMRAAAFAGAPASNWSADLRIDAMPNRSSALQQVPVILAGQDCMSEGYNFPHCHRIISLAAGWALDKMLQAEDRGWRLDSPESLHVYRLITDGTIDEPMALMQQEKQRGASAVLDAQW